MSQPIGKNKKYYGEYHWSHQSSSIKGMVIENFTLILGIARTFLNSFAQKYEGRAIGKEIINIHLGHSKLFGYKPK